MVSGCSAFAAKSPVLEHYPTQKSIQGFETNNYPLLPVAQLPYSRQALDYTIPDQILNLNDPEHPVDNAGAAVFKDGVSGKNEYNPVQMEQYGLAALAAFDRTGIAAYEMRAVANADKLLRVSIMRHGQMWFPYRFAYSYFSTTMEAPWWSGMAQGQGLSLFVRLYECDKNPKWLAAAKQTFLSFDATRKPGQPWASIIDSHNNLWFEEYAGDTPPLKVLNGDIFAIFGLYDYYMLTKSARARQLFDGGATTVIDQIAGFRVKDDVSYYCARIDYCHDARWQNPFYHPIHIAQLSMLGQMTGDPRFESWSKKFASDYSY